MLTSQVGGIAEAAVELDLLRRGFNVLRPTVPARYDICVETAPKTTIYVQVKSGSVNRGGDVFISCGKRPYSNAEVDVIAVHCAVLNTVYYVPIDQLRPGVKGFVLRITERRYKRVKSPALQADAFTRFPF